MEDIRACRTLTKAQCRTRQSETKPRDLALSNARSYAMMTIPCKSDAARNLNQAQLPLVNLRRIFPEISTGVGPCQLTFLLRYTRPRWVPTSFRASDKFTSDPNCETLDRSLVKRWDDNAGTTADWVAKESANGIHPQRLRTQSCCGWMAICASGAVTGSPPLATVATHRLHDGHQKRHQWKFWS